MRKRRVAIWLHRAWSCTAACVLVYAFVWAPFVLTPALVAFSIVGYFCVDILFLPMVPAKDAAPVAPAAPPVHVVFSEDVVIRAAARAAARAEVEAIERENGLWLESEREWQKHELLAFPVFGARRER